MTGHAVHIVFCTCPDTQTATLIANALVDKNLAACVNILPGVHSIYRWQGGRETSEEVLLLIKSRANLYAQVQAAILALHPYELPEIIGVPVAAGLPGYLAWVERSGNEP